MGEIIETENYAADEAFMAEFTPIIDEIKAYVDKPIGTFTKTISTRDAMFGDSPFMGLLHRIQLEMTDADVSFAAPLSFDATVNEGEVRVRDAFKLYQYENLLYTMVLTGKEIKDFLEYSYGNWFNQMSGPDDHLIAFKKTEDGKLEWSDRYNSYQTVVRYYQYDSAAGIIYTVDVSKPAGERVMIKSMADGSPFEMEKEYLVAINSYRGTGGGGHLTRGVGLEGEALTNRMRSSTIKDLRSYIAAWVEDMQTVDPQPQGNWNVVPADWWEKGKELDYKTLYEPTPPEK
jgi:2',3'-cyclic-nucleotide 2'-phosphodiesterase/3'-nucleotidase